MSDLNWFRATTTIPKHGQRVIVWPRGYVFPFVGVFEIKTPLQMGKIKSVANSAAGLWWVSEATNRPDDILWVPLEDDPWNGIPEPAKVDKPSGPVFVE
jgi:hypothetical protein